MSKEDLIRKLTSRKFWMAIAAFVSGLLLAYKVDADKVETISGVIMSGAAVVAYIFGEGLTDAAGSSSETNIIVPAQVQENTEE